MSACRSQFVNKVNWFFNIDHVIANARTAVAVKQSPTAAVAVNSERFIFRRIYKNLIIFFDLSCIRKHF